MRRAPGAAALFRSALLALVLVAAAQPGPGRAPDRGSHWAGDSATTVQLVRPLLGKRWA
jgi:hypothetical protein